MVGDIAHQTLTVRKGAYFEGRSVQPDLTKDADGDKSSKKQLRSVPNPARETTVAAG